MRLEIISQFRSPLWENIDRFVIVHREQRAGAFVRRPREYDGIAITVGDDADLVVIHPLWSQGDFDLHSPVRNEPSQSVEPVFEKLVADAAELVQELLANAF